MTQARIFVFVGVMGSMLCPAMSSCQSLQWIKYVTGSGEDLLSNATTDTAGNIYVTGHIGIPSAEVDGDLFDVLGYRDIFLSKFSSDGTYQWTATAGGSKNIPDWNEAERGYYVRYNSMSDQVILLGTYDSDESYFGPGLTVVGRGMFVAGYSTSGTCLWLQTVGWGTPRGIVVDQQGNTYVQFDREVWYDDCFVNKYSSAGDLLWSRSPGFHVNGGLSLKGDSLLVLSGLSQPNAELFGVPLESSSSVFDGLYATFDTSLSQVISSQQYLSSGYALLKESIPLQQGVIVSGTFSGSTIFENDTLVPAPNSAQPFVARLDDQGNVIWLNWYNSITTQEGLAHISLAVDSTVYVSFTSSSVVDLGLFTITPTTSRDFVVARYDLAGSCIGAVQGGEVQRGIGVHCTNDGGILINGWFTATLYLNGGTPSQGVDDGFIAKFSAITGIQTFGNILGGQLLIYANPNNGRCTVELPANLRYTPDLVLTIFDTQGRPVQSVPVTSSGERVRLDISAQAKGSYIVELTDGEQRYGGSIVFE